jgi:hypothetical protein
MLFLRRDGSVSFFWQRWRCGYAFMLVVGPRSNAAASRINENLVVPVAATG